MVLLRSSTAVKESTCKSPTKAWPPTASSKHTPLLTLPGSPGQVRAWGLWVESCLLVQSLHPTEAGSQNPRPGCDNRHTVRGSNSDGPDGRTHNPEGTVPGFTRVHCASPLALGLSGGSSAWAVCGLSPPSGLR